MSSGPPPVKPGLLVLEVLGGVLDLLGHAGQVAGLRKGVGSVVEATKAGLGGVISGLCVKVRDARPKAFRLKLFVTIGHPDFALVFRHSGVGSEQIGKPGLDHGDVLAQPVAADL